MCIVIRPFATSVPASSCVAVTAFSGGAATPLSMRTETTLSAGTLHMNAIRPDDKRCTVDTLSS